jgi:2-keto-4-pentenoate hydratase/2-oxohepta-3-ene-1,7-dioic acid hydratase in catechol pathway
MRLVTFTSSPTGSASPAGADRLGVLVDGDQAVVDVTGTAGLATMLELIEAGPAGMDAVAAVVARAPGERTVARAEVRLRAPLPWPRRIRDLGVLTSHLPGAFREMARRMAGPEQIDIDAEYARMEQRFGLNRTIRRSPNTLRDHLYISGPDDEVVAPRYSSELDYELEIGMVVGRTVRGVDEDTAAGCIFGFTIYNDWTARDRQVRNHRLGAGLNEDAKDFDGSNGLGPCIVTADELGDPNDLEGWVRVDGEQWSHGTTAEANFSWEHVVADISEARSIFAGEVWGSGTLRTGSAFEQGRRLPADCVVELEIERIGVLRNRAITAPRAPR